MNSVSQTQIAQPVRKTKSPCSLVGTIGTVLKWMMPAMLLQNATTDAVALPLAASRTLLAHEPDTAKPCVILNQKGELENRLSPLVPVSKCRKTRTSGDQTKITLTFTRENPNINYALLATIHSNYNAFTVTITDQNNNNERGLIYSGSYIRLPIFASNTYPITVSFSSLANIKIENAIVFPLEITKNPYHVSLDLQNLILLNYLKFGQSIPDGLEFDKESLKLSGNVLNPHQTAEFSILYPSPLSIPGKFIVRFNTPAPTTKPTQKPTAIPTGTPTKQPTMQPTGTPTTEKPMPKPTAEVTLAPTRSFDSLIDKLKNAYASSNIPQISRIMREIKTNFGQNISDEVFYSLIKATTSQSPTQQKTTTPSSATTKPNPTPQPTEEATNSPTLVPPTPILSDAPSSAPTTPKATYSPTLAPSTPIRSNAPSSAPTTQEEPNSPTVVPTTNSSNQTNLVSSQAENTPESEDENKHSKTIGGVVGGVGGVALCVLCGVLKVAAVRKENEKTDIKQAGQSPMNQSQPNN